MRERIECDAVATWGLVSRRRSGKVWFRGRAGRLEPSADIDLRMRLSAEMTSAFLTGCLCVPFEDSQLIAVASNHEPVHGIRADDATYLTSKFDYGRHSVTPINPTLLAI